MYPHTSAKKKIPTVWKEDWEYKQDKIKTPLAFLPRKGIKWQKDNEWA